MCLWLLQKNKLCATLYIQYIYAMAITKSAKKALRQNIKRKAHNLIYTNKIKSLIKETRFLVLEKKIKEAEAMLPKLYEALDKAAKVGVIKKNEASRKKSRLTKLIARSSK